MAKKEPNILDEVFGEDHELEAVLKQIKKQYGQGAIMKLGDRVSVKVDTMCCISSLFPLSIIFSSILLSIVTPLS
mgnify:CR=1 FL=1